MTPDSNSDIHARAILVSLRISSWSARKFDAKVSKEVTEAHGASQEAGRFNKNLLPGAKAEVPAKLSAARRKHAQAGAQVIEKSNSHKALMQHIAAMRVWYYQQTLAWSDDGWRLLPIANYQTFTKGVREGQHKFDTLLAEFVHDYPHLKATARQLLNGMFREDDYPNQVGERFRYGIEYAPVPERGDFRVQLSKSEIQKLEASTEARVKDGVEGAQHDAVKRLYTCLAKIHERLGGEDKNRKSGNKTFRDTLIENARELCDILKKLNLTDDPQLEKFRRETELLAAASEPETLRQNPDVRIETAQRAQSILNDMTAAFGKDLFA